MVLALGHHILHVHRCLQVERKSSGHVTALHIGRASADSCAPRLTACLELSSRSRSVTSAWERVSCPCSPKKHRTDHRTGLENFGAEVADAA